MFRPVLSGFPVFSIRDVLGAQMRRSTAFTLALALGSAGVVGLAAPGYGATTPQQKSALAVAEEAIATHPGAMAAAAGDSFVERTSTRDADGATHVHLDRLHDGLPVRAATSSCTTPQVDR